MAETPEDGGGDDAKLELPRLSIFRRRRKASDADRRAEDPGAPAPAEGAWDDTLTETPAPAVIPSPGLDDATDQTAEPEPASKPAATAETPVEPAATAETPVEPAATAETTVEAAATAETPVEPAAAAETTVEPAAAAAQTEPETAGVPGTMFPNAVEESGDEPTQVLPTQDPAPLPAGDDRDDTPAPDRDETEEPVTKKRRARRELTLPALDARIAAPVTGVVVGLAGVALTLIGQQGCKAVKGTSSCGGVGLFLLIAILILMILFGAALLKAWHIGDPTNSSFLAVGLVAVFAMLFFLPDIGRWYMVIVVPLLSALTYLLSWWVTNTFIESAEN